MRPNLTPDIDLATRLFDTLRARTFDGIGITREAYGPGERIAHEIVRSEAERLGLETRTDPAGNLLMTLPGRDRAAKRIILGSHLDSVPQGGNFDGAAGVLAGLAAVAGMKHAGFQPARDITVLAIRAEEGGAWFPSGLPGSRAALGRLPPEHLQVARLDSGRALAEHMREEGFDPDAVARGECLLPPDSIEAYVELHIEQGPVLEAQKIPVALVTGLPGSRRIRTGRVLGEYNHSGATPRRYRRDAAIALAEFATRLDDEWAHLETLGHRLVVTFCIMATTEQAGFTKVPGEARFQIDIRGTTVEAIDAVHAAIDRLIADVQARRGVTFELERGPLSPPTPMSPEIRSGLSRAAEELGIDYLTMPSGGGHDAGAFAQAGVPTCMLFVRNQHGSHNPHEAMRIEDFARGCEIITRWAAQAAS
ncbi:MAG: hydantoinase/carbamoylase family amidase [Acetobacteraceae bacterium]|nr:hydantoinase/carbamoylase family amidase [Acetobacteraceae bacterium]